MHSNMFFLISFLWFVHQIKIILFWIYLWQLKEYHIGRFLDHFRTDKGRRIFLNLSFILKTTLFFYVLIIYFSLGRIVFQPFHYGWIFVLLIIYFLESAKFLKDIFQKRLKKPVFTKKTFILLSANLIFIIFFVFFLFKKTTNLIYRFSFGLLFIDVISPFLISAVILLFQPITVLLRNRIIKKAKEKRRKFKNLITVGITGSYGKTSTKEFLATILEEKFPGRVLKTKEHQNSEIGISQCILNCLKPEHKIFIVEMGAYNRGGIKLLCDIAKPQYGIITGINEQHMATFGSLENIIKTKYELAENLPNHGLVVFNGDNEYCHQLYKNTKISKRICYSNTFDFQNSQPTADYWIKNIEAKREILSFDVFSRWGETAQFRVNLSGKHLSQNILMAAIIAKEVFGISLEEISTACQRFKPEQTGMKLIKGLNNLDIIEATYSANPEGVNAHLDYLNGFNNKKIIIMPCLIELGKASKKIHYKIGQKIGKICHLAIITTKERFRDIKNGAIESGMPATNILFIEAPRKIFEKIKNFCGDGDAVLLEGRLPTKLISLLIGEKKTI